MNHLQNFGKIIDLKNIILGIFAGFLLIEKKNYLSDEISVKKTNNELCILYHSQVEIFSVLFIYHLRKLRLRNYCSEKKENLKAWF